MAGCTRSDGASEHQQWRLGRELLAGKIAVLLEFAAAMVPQNARPVIQALERQVHVFVGFQFQHGKPAVASAGKHVNHRAI